MYETKELYTILKIYSEKEQRYFEVIIDTEDLEKVKNKKICMRLEKGNYIPRIFNGKYYMSLQSFLTPELKISYSKNKNYLDCRKSNITSSPHEVEGFIEHRSLKIKESSLKMSKEKRNNIIKGMRENRYSKDYANKLQEHQLGEKNLNSVLTWDLVNEIRDIARNQNISQYELSDRFNVGRGTIADITNYRTWTINPELNERIYKEDNVKIVKNVNISNNTEFTYNDILFNNILLKFNDERLYVEKLSIEGLIYIEQRDNENKYLASVDVYIPKHKNKSMKKFYIIAKMNPKSKGRPYFYSLIEKAFNQLKEL